MIDVHPFLISGPEADGKEMTRVVVKVIYEEKKPDVEIFTPQKEKTPSGRTTFSEFIASLPTFISDVFKSYIENWIKEGRILYFGKVGFSFRIKWKDRERTIFDAYPDCASILQEKCVKEFDLPREAYDEYKSELMSVPLFGSIFASRKKYVYYKKVSEEEFVLILNSTEKLLNSFLLFEDQELLESRYGNDRKNC